MAVYSPLALGKTAYTLVKIWIIRKTQIIQIIRNIRNIRNIRIIRTFRTFRNTPPPSLIHHGIAVTQAAMLLLRSQAAEELTHPHDGDAL